MAAESAQLKEQKKQKSWTQSEIFRLIDLYEERPCLWDVFSSDYHDRDVTGKAKSRMTRTLSSSSLNVNIKNTLAAALLLSTKLIVSIIFIISLPSPCLFTPKLHCVAYHAMKLRVTLAILSFSFGPR